MNSQSQFVGFDELAPVLGVSVKKLRADLDVASGEIRLGGTVPPIQTLKIGHLRMVAKATLGQWLAGVGAVSEEKANASWLAGVGAISEEKVNAHPAPEVEVPAKRRGRPRKAAASSGSLA